MLHVHHIREAREFYCGRLGFEEVWKNQPDSASENPSYIGVRLGDIILHLSSFSGDGIPSGVTVLSLDDLKGYCEEVASAGVDLGSGPVEQTWGIGNATLAIPQESALSDSGDGMSTWPSVWRLPIPVGSGIGSGRN